MKITIVMVGIIFTLFFFVLEAIIKGVMYILYFPLILCIALIYPFIKAGHIYLGFGKDLNWIEKWWKYATTWEKGFYSCYIYKLWKVED